jgi:hypothetical protein
MRFRAGRARPGEQVVGRPLGVAKRGGDPSSLESRALPCRLDGLILEVVFVCCAREHNRGVGRRHSVQRAAPALRRSRDWRPDLIHTNKKELLVCSRGLFMTRQVPISYPLPFACIFDARSKPLSTMPKSPYHYATDGSDHRGSPPNSSAARCGRNQRNIIDHGRGRNNLTRFPARADQDRPRP